MAEDQIKLSIGGKESTDFRVKPMTWGKQKEVLHVLGQGLARVVETRELAARFVASLIADGRPSLQTLLEAMEQVPELLTEVLALGLAVDKDDLEASSGIQVVAALEAFILVNELAEQFARSKKAFSLLSPATEQAKAAA